MNRPRPRNQAVTLIELTVALAIVAMLMVAAMAVLSGVSRAEAKASRRHEESWVVAPLRDLIVADLRHAESYTPGPGGGLLQTRVALAPGTMEMNHLPVTVAWRVQRIASVNWLVRWQRAMTPGQDMAELVCSGVKSFDIESKGAGPAVFTATVRFDSPGREPLKCTVRQE